MALFRMPSLGADMEAGTLVEWLVGPGDSVKRGDVVAVVETQKGAIEIECFEEGVVRELQAELGRELPVGAPLALILAEGESTPEPEAVPVPTPEPKAVAVAVPAPAPDSPRPPEPVAAPPPSDGRQAASPAARVLARDRGIALASLAGSGPGGAILLADVEAATGTAAPPRPSSPMDAMRKAIAAAMTRAKQSIPHFYLSETIDVQPAIDWLARENEGRPPAERILLGALFVRATVLAATRVKPMNGHYIDGAFRPSAQVNAGVAVALRGGGLVAPALIGAERMDVAATMAGMRDLVSRARAGRLRSSEMTEGTITISSLGETGAEAMTGVIFPPQVALVGIGAPHLRPWVVAGAVVPRNVVVLTVSADHRVSDGRQVARFIAEFETLIAAPESL
jgi:pyruvate dehydrogenase E2 component (dihydrolipoamide acetyltransferase)